jgi:carboxymethylenebutenolidase
MCHADDSLPPLPPVSGGARDVGETVLTADDGNRFKAYYAHPDKEATRAMVVMPDVRGLHPFYEDLARRFAEAGLHSIAMDYFGRTAGLDERDESFEFMTHVQQMKPETARADVAAAVAWLRSPEGGGATSVFTVGFCMGGALSWAQSAGGHGLAGCVGFYGMPSRVVEVIPQMEAPLLLLVAGQDFTPLPEFEKFSAALGEAGVEHEMHVYPDAPHSYFDRAYEQHKEACEDSWRRILAFIDAHSD